MRTKRTKIRMSSCKRPIIFAQQTQRRSKRSTKLSSKVVNLEINLGIESRNLRESEGRNARGTAHLDSQQQAFEAAKVI